MTSPPGTPGRSPRRCGRTLRPVAEPVLRETGLREIDRRLGRAIGSTSAALGAGYEPSVDWWADALAACGRGIRVEVAADGTVARAEVTG